MQKKSIALVGIHFDRWLQSYSVQGAHFDVPREEFPNIIVKVRGYAVRPHVGNK
jgi:hypothetical protein